MERPGNFERSVTLVLERLRPGEVVTYGEVAEEAGFPGAARAVGNLLATGTEGVAWWRVVRADGSLAARNRAEQARRLRAEGVSIAEGRVLSADRGRGTPPDRRGRNTSKTVKPFR